MARVTKCVVEMPPMVTKKKRVGRRDGVVAEPLPHVRDSKLAFRALYVRAC